MRRIGLVGCVNEKDDRRLPAKYLYRSPLFAGRRWYVEKSCSEWWILSAKHGLLHPDEPIEPYDVALKNCTMAARRMWSEHVLQAIARRVEPKDEDIFEIHAGAEYRNSGLVVDGRLLGCRVINPTQGMRLGQQLHFYKRHACSPATTTPASGVPGARTR